MAMGPHTHRLNKDVHAPFIAKGHVDPVTGEKVKEGDLVVVCAVCGTAMRGETWLLLGGAHCGQSETAVTLLEVGPGALGHFAATSQLSKPGGWWQSRGLMLGLIACFSILVLAVLLNWNRGQEQAPLLDAAGAALIDSIVAQTSLNQIVSDSLGGELITEVSTPAENDARSLVLFKNDDEELRIAILDSTRVAFNLGQAFSADTRIAGLAFRTIGDVDVVTFEASDDRWESSYIWEIDADELAFRSHNRSTDDVRYSNGLTAKAAFAQYLGYESERELAYDATPEAVAAHALGVYPIQTISDGGGRGRIVTIYEMPDGKSRVAFLDGGRVRRRLAQSFSSATEFDALAFRTIGGRDVAVFIARDARWVSTYAWDFGPNSLYWRTTDRRDGSVNWSRNIDLGSPIARYLASPH